MTVRELVYGLISNDSELATLGLTPDTLFANGAPDSPPDAPGKIWAVLRWGAETGALLGGAARGRGHVSERDCELWVYSREDDFGDINQAIKRWCAVMDGLEATRTGVGPVDGWVVATQWQGDSADGWDDVYAANYRSSAYTIVASGD
jgi:hypothetical protein